MPKWDTPSNVIAREITYENTIPQFRVMTSIPPSNPSFSGRVNSAILVLT